MGKVHLKGAVALLFGMVLVVLVSKGPVGRTAEVEGHVYRARDSRGAPVDPVVSAVISTSLGSNTVITDQAGHFRLETRMRVAGDEFYIITVKSGDVTWRRRTVSPHMTNQQFVLSESSRW